MSIEAINYAFKCQTKNATQKAVLLVLANYSNENNQSYPSISTISRLSSCQDRTVIRALKELEESGFIQKMPRFNEKGQTSNLYTVGGDNIDMGGVTETTPYTKEDTVNNNKIRGDKKDTPYTSQFRQWWELYPRKAGSKKEAFKVFQKVLQKEDYGKIYKATDIFSHNIRLNNHTDVKFIPHPVTWLRQERWETVTKEENNTNLNRLAG